MGLDGTGVSDRAPTKRVVAFTSRVAGSCACGCLLPGGCTRTRRVNSVRVRSLSCCPAGAAAYVRCSLSSLFRHKFRAGGKDVHAPRSVRDCTALTAVVFRAGRGRRRKKRTVPTFSFFVTGKILGDFRGVVTARLKLLLSVGKRAASRGRVLGKVHTRFRDVTPGRRARGTCLSSLRTRNVSLATSRLGCILHGALTRAHGSARRTVRNFVRGLGAVRSEKNGRIIFDSVGCNASASTRKEVIVRRLLGTAVRNLKGRKRIPIFPVRVFGIGSKIDCSRTSCRLTVGSFRTTLSKRIGFRYPGFSLFLRTYHAATGTLFPGFVFLSAPFGGRRG